MRGQTLFSLSTKLYIVRWKGKVHPSTGHEAFGGGGYNCPLSLTSALDGGEWSVLCPNWFIPRKGTRYPSYRRLGGPQGQSGRVQRISPPPGFDPQTVQHVASYYTYCAILALYQNYTECFFFFLSLVFLCLHY